MQMETMKRPCLIHLRHKARFLARTGLFFESYVAKCHVYLYVIYD
jgi:hypothetical protein